MKTFSNHLRGIAYFLSTLILFQSCIVYKGRNFSSREAAQYDKRRIRIETWDGVIIKLRWIEEKDGQIYSIKNTRRKYIDKSRIINIKKYDPVFTLISLDTVLNLQGNIEVVTKKKGYDNYATYNFIKIKDDGQNIIGYMMTGKDTTTVLIPTEKISRIEVENRTGTILGTTAIVIPGLWLLLLLGASIALLIEIITHEPS
jgi:hypothetical protein